MLYGQTHVSGVTRQQAYAQNDRRDVASPHQIMNTPLVGRRFSGPPSLLCCWGYS